jgi:hypothetical protein
MVRALVKRKEKRINGTTTGAERSVMSKHDNQNKCKESNTLRVEFASKSRVELMKNNTSQTELAKNNTPRVEFEGNTS